MHSPSSHACKVMYQTRLREQRTQLIVVGGVETPRDIRFRVESGGENLCMSFPCETTEAVVCGVLVQLCERGEVEHAVDEDIDRAASEHHHLANVDEFRRAVADDVNAEQFLRRHSEEQFQQS